MGGSITPGGMLFIALAGYWLGPARGMLVGITVGLLGTITGVWFLHPVQYMLDYLVGYGALGLAGLFRKLPHGLQIGYAAGAFMRFVSVFFAGWIFWGHYAPEGQHPAIYSALYNITYVGVEALITLFIISSPVVKGTIDRITRESVSA